MNLRKYLPRIEVRERPDFSDLEIRIRNKLRDSPFSTIQLGAELLIIGPKEITGACERMNELGYISGEPIKGVNLDRYETPLEGYKWEWKAGPPLLSVIFGN